MRRLTLFNKTLFFMVVVFGVIAISTSFISSWQLNTYLTDEYISKAHALARTMAESDLELMLNRDAAAIQSRIDQYLAIEGVSHVVVADSKGDILAHTFVPVVPENIRAMLHDMAAGRSLDPGSMTPSDVVSKNGELHVTYPILDGMIGYVHIGMDLGAVKTFIRSAVLRQQGMTALVFFGCVILAWAFVSNISRPLGRLQEYARRVAVRDYGAVLNIDSKDEIGELAGTMTAMTSEINDLVEGLEDRVHKATAQLLQGKDDLERKVEERTSELSRTNIQLKIEIAERKVVGEALKKTEQKYRSIFENAVEGIFQFSQDGYYISANPAMARIFGFNSPAEFMSSVNGGDQKFHMD
ncbi:MAG: HAMP domain-containing protein [Proteobacteria bacterium]|nr:HAMP domain-containing protein [Pseudomonadota bacterium]